MGPNDVFLTTENIEPRLRADFVRECMAPMHELIFHDLGKERGIGVNASIRSRTLGTLLFMSTRYGVHERRRDHRLISHSDFDFYTVHLLMSGQHIGDFAGRPLTANTGDLYITDMSRPVSQHIEAGGGQAAVVPRREMEGLVGGRDLHGVVLRAHWPMTRLISDCLLGLDNVVNELTAAQMSGAQEALTTLLATGLKGDTVSYERLPSALSMIFRRRVLEFIDRHIFDPRLSPEVLGRAFRVSRAHLYRAFESDGGVAKLIRDRRLAFAYKKLVNARSPDLSVKELADLCGFSSSGAFIRAFRERFGVTPASVRLNGSSMLESESEISKLQTYFGHCLAR